MNRARKSNIINERESKPIVVFLKDGKFVGEYPNYGDCMFKLNIPGIANFFKGAVHHIRGYIFIEKEKYKEGMIITYDSIVRKRKFFKDRMNNNKN